APSFATLLRRVQRAALEAYAHQDLPFERLVDELQPERDLSRSPVFQVMFALQNMPLDPTDLSGLRVSPIRVQRRAALFDLVLDIWDVPEGLNGVLEYNSDLFDEETVAQMMQHFVRVLEALALDPEQSIERLPLLDAAERTRLLSFSNGPRVDHPVHHSLAAGFEAQVVADPGRVAASAAGRALSYGALNVDANRIANLLRQLGVGRESVVGLLLPRGLDYLAALLGVVKSGAAFLPLDTSYPPDRLRYMVADAGLSVLVTTSDGRALLAEGPPATLTDVLLLDRDHADADPTWAGLGVHGRAALAQQPGANPPLANEPRDTLYLLYTSGSTGQPKGTLVRHDGALNHIHAEARLLGLGSDTAFLQSAPASSDISVWQCLAPLLLGGRVVFADFATTCSPPDLFALIRRERVTLIELVPVLLDGLLSHALTLPQAVRALPELRCAMVTGEAVSAALVARWFEQWPDTPLVNAYGPSEAADDVCQCALSGPLSETAALVPIGTPIDNMSVLVLDGAGAMQPIGVPGEICISGIGVGPGYWRQPERTAAAFRRNQFEADTYGETLYHTGDLGRWRRDGRLEFIGRLDQQVKIRGFRVELGEIEACIAAHPEVRDAVVMDREARTGERTLAAYIRPREVAGGERDLVEEQLARWRDLHDASYGDTQFLERDPTFNTIGWDSTFTGEPLSPAEMEEAVRNAVDRVLALRPRRLLEIGCGTGLLFHRLAPCCEAYLGTDLAAVAIRQLEAQRAALQLARPEQVELRVQAAHDVDGIAPGAFDTVVLNSVVQYFPGLDYLLQVLREVVGRCADGGAVFIGDVRDLATLPAYHASVQLHKAGGPLSDAELAARIAPAMDREQELILSPALFLALRDQIPRIGAVEVRPKRGRIGNELLRFRYDVVLRVGQSAPVEAEADALDWRSSPRGIEQIAAQLRREAPAKLVLRHVANARLRQERRFAARIQAGEAAVLEGLDPEAVWALAEDLPYDIDIRLEPGDGDGAFAVRLLRHGTAAAAWAGPPAAAGDLASYANDPLRQSRARRLVQQLRMHLKATLPGHMIPAAITVLDQLPLTPNGKIDRLALAAAPSVEEIEDRTAPRTRTEQVLQAIWAAVLGVEQPGIHANFFALGGHSLRVTQIVTRVAEDIGVALALRDVFTWPTIAELAAFIDRSIDTAQRPAIPRAEPAPHYPVSHAQQRLWVLDQIGAAGAYHMTAALRLRGRLVAEALQRAVAELHQRHETLRTGLVEIEGVLRQAIAEAVTPRLRSVDLSEAADPQAAARSEALVHASLPFDLARPPLLRIDLL
ncbi:MAG: amino acid adenylation domain-containing protein, partial [Acetobacteraceae bacterium]|nr:amino acid adenylation domain-containing protein [Acetobacteraceae bacterium]